MRERRAQRDPLPLATGKLIGASVGTVTESVRATPATFSMGGTGLENSDLLRSRGRRRSESRSRCLDRYQAHWSPGFGAGSAIRRRNPVELLERIQP